MRRLIISTAIIALLGCGESGDSNDQTSTDGINPDSTTSTDDNTGMQASPSDGGPADNNGTARTDVIALAQEAGEATADQCPNGGVVLNLGVDTNGNGVLDDDEVTGNEVVCNGRDGRDGRDGQNSEATSGYQGVLLGSYTIYNDPDAHLIRGVTEITGSLSVGSNVRRVDLPALTTIGGVDGGLERGLSIGRNAMRELKITELSLPVLSSVGGDLHILDTGLTRVDLPALTTIDGYMKIEWNGELTELSMPALTTVGDELNVEGNPELTELSMPALTTVGGDLGYWDHNAFGECDIQAQLDAGNGVQCGGD